MVERLLKLRDELVHMAHLHVCLSEAERNDVEHFECLLCHPKIFFTKKLQTTYLTSGTFYKEWKNVLFKFTQISSVVANAMKKSMEELDNVLLDMDVVLAEVYVDVMYTVTSINDQQKRGKKALVAIVLDMKEHE